MNLVPAEVAADILRPSGGVFGCRGLWVKRAADVVLAAAGLVLLAPLMAAVAAAVLLRNGRPVIFSQERIGREGRSFRLYKFRTLPVCPPRESDRRWNAEPRDPLSRFLRVTGLDELPQLYNVLRGEMSLVGPRPERPFFAARFRSELPRYALRECAVPGLTGWAQVNGLRGNTSIATRLEYDLYYLHHWSLAFDAQILWLTLKGSLRQAAAFVRGNA
jgi:lipopolysaccharide/colanic/teichoic acid biosynthesis glycosyltransferase